MHVQVLSYSAAGVENHRELSPEELNQLRHQRRELCQVGGRGVPAACRPASLVPPCLLVQKEQMLTRTGSMLDSGCSCLHPAQALKRLLPLLEAMLTTEWKLSSESTTLGPGSNAGNKMTIPGLVRNFISSK